MPEPHTGNCRCIKSPAPREYIVTVKGPDGAEMTVHIPEAQVKLFVSMESSRPFSTATWLAYCDLWVTE
jgi:hypothetical protein